MYRLINPWRDYAWGAPDSIPRFLGQAETGSPVAEVWMGTHDAAPSHVETADGIMVLSSVVGELPFMAKLLAASQPLSLQVHPDTDQAQRGFALEESQGQPRNDPSRNYRDARAKPEMVYALSRFETLVGFRPTAEILRVLAPLDTSASRLLHERLSADPGFAGIVKLVDFILTSPQLTDVDVTEIVVRCQELMHVGVDVKRAFATAVEVAEHYPVDRGVIVALLLNRLTLQAGEAAFLEPGIIHAHLSGMCLEVMATSDNVLRAGLTSKHVDVAELVRTLDEGTARLARVTPEVRGSTEMFKVGADDFALAVTQCAGRATADIELGPPRDRIVVCLGGEAVLINEQGEKEQLGRGESLYAGPDDGFLTLSGTCEVAVAFRPARPGDSDRLVPLV